MINLDDDLTNEYLARCRDHLAVIETGLLAMEDDIGQNGNEVLNRSFRAVHSIKGGAGLFGLGKIRGLSHRMEGLLALLRNGEMAVTVGVVRVLLLAVDQLRDLIQDPDGSEEVDISYIVAALDGLYPDAGGAGIAQPPGNPGTLRTLLVEDDFASRLLLQTFLSRYGECHVAANGREAVDAYSSAWELGQRYDLICMDIMMPEMDGCEAVQRVRAFEESRGVLSTHGAKIIMTTTVREFKEVIRCFMELCDAYLVKPIDLAKLLGHMTAYRLVP